MGLQDVLGSQTGAGRGAPPLIAAWIAVLGWSTLFAAEPDHWAFRLVVDPPVPTVEGAGTLDSPIDTFVLSRLQERNLSPARPADKYELLRRATFDLIGLPPTPEEVETFVNDRAPDAYARLIDRLLASPHYGERWGRYWLDLVRYSDTNGADENKAYGHAWRYRDYVIRALNEDKPYDRFVLEQLAGDLLDDTGTEKQTRDNLIATGFLVLGPKMLAEQDKEKLVMDVVDEQIDVAGNTFLGLTLGCARCHDHKFDPIAAREYYALAGVFKSTQTMANLEHVSMWQERRLPSAEIEAALARFEAEVGPQIDEKKAEIERLVAQANEQLQLESAGKLPEKPEEQYSEEVRQQLTALRDEVQKLEADRPEFPLAMAVLDGEPQDVPVHLRGNHLTLVNEPTPRGVLDLFEGIVPEPEISSSRSGRLETARWITDPRHPLTARVMVNRIWQGHFGEGLVRTPSNFGRRGEPPTHPELLDWLAARFIESGWSMKTMHRLIMLSRTYQMSSEFDSYAAEVDPENRLLWRQNRRRLEAEPIRDALFAVAGNLDRTMGGSLLRSPNNEYSREKSSDEIFDAPRRAVYLPILRNKNYDFFSIFDYANPGVHVEQRTDTTVAHQALLMMNSPLVMQQARSLAERLLNRDELNDEQRVRALYLTLYARPAADEEVARALAYLESGSQTQPEDRPADEARRTAWSDLCHALMAVNEFIYVR